MSIIKKIKFVYYFISLVIALQLALPALAVQNAINPWGDDTKKDRISEITGLGERDPRNIVADIINVVLGFLGIIAVGIILLGGFKWMTAGGSEDKIGEAKKLITAGVIGLVIILASFALASFVLRQLVNATT